MHSSDGSEGTSSVPPWPGLEYCRPDSVYAEISSRAWAERRQATTLLSEVRGHGCFLTIFTALSTGSRTNFIPSGASGTESIFRKANSEDRTTSALFNFDQLYLLVCVINGVFHTLGREGNAIHARIGEFRETLRHPSVVLNEFMQLNRHERLDGALESFNLHRLGLGGRRVRLA